MVDTVRNDLMSSLRGRIAALETQSPLMRSRNEGDRTIDLGFGRLHSGFLHEVWVDRFQHSGAALGFSIGLAGRFIHESRSVIIWLQLRGDSQEYGLPYGGGVERFGVDPARLIIGRFSAISDLLWAAEEALTSSSVAAIIADLGQEHRKADFTATRRLILRGQQADTSVFLLRYGLERELSAAPLRWSVGPHPSAEMAFDPRAPGMPSWRVALEKGWQRFAGLKGPQSWIVNWTENGFAFASHGVAAQQEQTVFGSISATLGNGLSRTA